jgi:alkylation response protein AidB-like acyl-CoA dehydrogenase
MTSTAKSLLADIQSLAPDIAARAAEIEAGRGIPIDLVKDLRSVGVFRLLVPRSHGGLELELSQAVEVIAALSKIEGSVGWIAMIAGGTQLLAPLLPRETYDQVYRNGPDVIFAGSNQPAGTAEATSGGWRVSGRWPFASGSQHADWIAGYCVMMQDGAALPGPVAGAPLMRGFFLPAHHWQIEDTWYAAGLKGTGSHHVVLKDTVVPDANFFDLMGGLPCLPGPLYQAPLQTFPLLHGPFGVGVADGALDELVAHARTGRQQFRAAASMRDTEAFQYELGRTESELRAARAFLEVQVASHWHRALTGTLRNEAVFTQVTQGAIWLSNACIRVVDACFALGGGSALYETSPLQRRLRDIHVAGQHVTVQRRHYVDAGKLLLGPPASDGTERKNTSARIYDWPRDKVG